MISKCRIWSVHGSTPSNWVSLLEASGLFSRIPTEVWDLCAYSSLGIGPFGKRPLFGKSVLTRLLAAPLLKVNLWWFNGKPSSWQKKSPSIQAKCTSLNLERRRSPLALGPLLSFFFDQLSARQPKVADLHGTVLKGTVRGEVISTETG